MASAARPGYEAVVNRCNLPVLVYQDDGAGPFISGCLLRACREAHGAAEFVSAEQLLASDDWHTRAAALAIPGGADRPYARKLDGRGNASIRRYIEQGGRLLGVCAGAYYCCRRIDFTGADFAVKAPRELGLYPGTAIGSLSELAARYRLDDLDCSAVTKITYKHDEADVFYWGGCRFAADDDLDEIDVLARYADLPDGNDVAAIRTRIGDGIVVLTGIHAEVRGVDFDRERFHYPNGNAPRFAEQAAKLQSAEATRAALWSHLFRALEIA